MMDRETRGPLLVGLIVALVVHAAVLIRFSGASDGWVSPWSIPPDRSPFKPQVTKPAEPTVGQLEPGGPTINLITFDDYRELMARQSVVEQPATQQMVDPTELTDQTPLDPTPPAMTTPPVDQTPALPMPAPASVPEPMPAEPMAPAPQPSAPLPMPIELAQSDVDADVRMPAEPSETEAPPAQSQASPPTPPTPEAHPTPEAPAVDAASQADPTVAPRTDMESPPASRTDSATVQPGSVISTQGIKIKTVVPRYDRVALMTSIPRNPTVNVTFNAEGKVIDATIVQSSGYPNVDGPILTSLYKWTAEGPIRHRFHLRELRIILIKE